MAKNLFPYPRRVFRRKVLRTIGKFIIRRLTDFTIEGEENFPENGPYIIAGNHVAAMEVLLMTLFSPEHIEILGSGDIPLDPKLAPFANLYGYIPINRGSVDQKAINQAEYVLNKRGVIGIFPEGGIWSRNIKQAKLGVSWISFRSKAPILPVGFVGMQGALSQMLRLRKPRLKMRVGNILTYKHLFNSLSEKSKKSQLQDAADMVLCAIRDLLPSHEQEVDDVDVVLQQSLRYQYYFNNEFRIFEFEDKEGVSMVLQHPVIMDVFKRNLKLPVKALSSFNKKVKLQSMITSVSSICNYLNENPGFFVYRFGPDLGRVMENGLRNYLTALTKLNYDKNIMVEISEHL